MQDDAFQMSRKSYLYQITFQCLIQVDSAYNIPRHNVLFGYKVLFHLSRMDLCTLFVYVLSGIKYLFSLSRGVRYMRSRPVYGPSKAETKLWSHSGEIEIFVGVGAHGYDKCSHKILG